MKNFINKIENNRGLNIIKTVIKTILYIVLIAMLLVIVVQKVTNNNMSIGGIRVFTIVSGSMEPKYNIGDILISKSVDVNTLNIGDDVTYIGKKGDLNDLVVTHQIVNKFDDATGIHFITKGINNEIADPQIDGSQIYGKIIYKTILLSFVCKLMNNIIAYFVIFGIVSVMVSYQIVRAIYDRNDGDDENEGAKQK